MVAGSATLNSVLRANSETTRIRSTTSEEVVRFKKSKDGKTASASSEKGPSGGKGGKENYEGADSVASHEDRFVDSDDEDELVFDPLDDVVSDETSETGGHGASVPPPHPLALDLRGMPMQPLHSTMTNQHSGISIQSHGGPPQYGGQVVPSAVESLHSANPIDKLYLMQDSYFTQM